MIIMASILQFLSTFLALLLVAHAQTCRDECLTQQRTCYAGCKGFIFGEELCESMCAVGSSNCITRCPPETATASPNAPGSAASNLAPTFSEPSSTRADTRTCGRANNDRIFGGADAKECEYPWMVIMYNQVRRTVCGGTIVNRKYIMTAAHCVTYSSGRYGRIVAASELIVFSGTSRMPLNQDFGEFSNASRNYVEAVKVYPKYNVLTAVNDIAVLKLRNELPTDTCHTPVCMTSGTELASDLSGCRVMGWGRTATVDDAVSDLQWVSVPLQSDYVCQQLYGRSSSKTICAGKRGSDSCKGDSGGPLVCRGSDGAFTQYGIVSLGLSQCGAAPGLYTKVASFLPWLQENIEEEVPVRG